MTLPRKERDVLEQLVTGDKYGLELVAASSRGLARGTLYVLLGRMEDRELIEGRADDSLSNLPRRRYRITDLGRRLLEDDTLGGLPSRHWGPFRQEFYSICSAHQRNDATCELCGKGMWLNVHRKRVSSFVYKRWPDLWRWWANR